MNISGIVTVGYGRGFVVKRGRDRLILTAAHCLPVDARGKLKLPPAHPFSYTEERTYQKLLGPLGVKRAKLMVWAECLFIDPVGDIAVLGSPDSQALGEEAEAYDALVDGMKPLAIGDAPRMGRERVPLPYGGESIEHKTPGQGSARVLSLGGEWLTCTVTRPGIRLVVEDQGIIQGGMSGSPIVSMDGKAISLLSSDGSNPVLRDSLPAWFFRR